MTILLHRARLFHVGNLSYTITCCDFDETITEKRENLNEKTRKSAIGSQLEFGYIIGYKFEISLSIDYYKLNRVIQDYQILNSMIGVKYLI